MFTSLLHKRLFWRNQLKPISTFCFLRFARARIHTKTRNVKIISSKLIRYDESQASTRGMPVKYTNSSQEEFYGEIFGLDGAFIGGLWILPKTININHLEKCIKYSLLHFPWLSSRIKYNPKSNSLNTTVEHNNGGVELNTASFEMLSYSKDNDIINQVAASFDPGFRDQYIDAGGKRSPKSLLLFDRYRNDKNIMQNSSLLSIQVTNFNNINQTILNDLCVLSFSISHLIADAASAYGYIEYLSGLMDTYQKNIDIDKNYSLYNDTSISIIPYPKPRLETGLVTPDMQYIPPNMKIESKEDFKRVYNDICMATKERMKDVASVRSNNKFLNCSIDTINNLNDKEKYNLMYDYKNNFTLYSYPITFAWKLLLRYRRLIFGKLLFTPSKRFGNWNKQCVEIYLSNEFLNELKSNYIQQIMDDNELNNNNNNDISNNNSQVNLSTFEVITGWLYPIIGKIESRDKKYGFSDYVYVTNLRNRFFNLKKYDFGSIVTNIYITNISDNVPLNEKEKQSYKVAYNINKHSTAYLRNINKSDTCNEIAQAHFNQTAYIRKKTDEYTNGTLTPKIALINDYFTQKLFQSTDLRSLGLYDNFQFGTNCVPLQYLTSSHYSFNRFMVLPLSPHCNNGGVRIYLRFMKPKHLQTFVNTISKQKMDQQMHQDDNQLPNNQHTVVAIDRDHSTRNVIEEFVLRRR